MHCKFLPRWRNPSPASAPFTASSQKVGNLPPAGGAVLGKGRWSCAGLGPQRTDAEGCSGCPALTGHLLFRSSGSWMSSPQPPPCATSMTCKLGCAGFQDICRPYLPLGGQVRGVSRLSLLAKGGFLSQEAVCLWAGERSSPGWREQLA